MAESIGKHECTLCLEDFTKPKILPCFHTFCEECLRVLIQSHAHSKRFNCPVCRRQIEVPVGGASGFSTNFYLDEPKPKPNPSPIQYCTKHKQREIDFYCRDCCVPACDKCIIIDHTTHSKADLTEVDQEYRTRLTSSKEILEKKIQQHQADMELLKFKSASITKSADTASNNIDTQVEKIYDEAKKLGTQFKEEIYQLCDVEIRKVEQLMFDKYNLIANLQTVVDSSSTTLTGTCTKSLIDISQYLETLSVSEDSNNLTTDVSVEKHSYFPLVEINTNLLQQQLGELQTRNASTFTASFNPEKIKQKDVNYYSDDYVIQGLSWQVSVKHNTETSTLDVFLWLKKIDNVKFISCAIEQTIILLNQSDDLKSFTYKTEYVYKLGRGWGWHKFVPWNKLTDPTYGFLNNNIFTLQTTVKLINLQLVK